MKKCRINRFDCRRLWKYNRNLMGTCLELDPSTLMIQMPKTKKVSLGFTFGVNISGNLSLLMSTDYDLIWNISVNVIIAISDNQKRVQTLHLSKLSLYLGFEFRQISTKSFGSPIKVFRSIIWLEWVHVWFWCLLLSLHQATR